MSLNNVAWARSANTALMMARDTVQFAIGRPDDRAEVERALGIALNALSEIEDALAESFGKVEKARATQSYIVAALDKKVRKWGKKKGETLCSNDITAHQIARQVQEVLFQLRLQIAERIATDANKVEGK